jgi:hypothetical protein
MGYGALESSFEMDFSESRAGSKSGLTRPTASMGLAKPMAGVGPNPHSSVGLAKPTPALGLEPLPAVRPGLSFMGVFFFFFFTRWSFFLLGISHFD